MCESHAYVLRGDKEEKVLDDVTFVQPENGTVLLRSLLGDEIRVQGRIYQILLMDHKILIRETP